MAVFLRHLRPTREAPPLGDEPDAVLVARAQTDPEHFAPLYLRYLEEIGRFCYVRLSDEEAARDAAQQVFAQALAGLHGYRETGQFRAWLYTIARHVLANEARSWRGALDLEAVGETADPGATPEETATAALDRRAVLDAVSRLPDDQRIAIELRLSGLTGREVAAAMGRGHDAIRKLQLRALEKLRADLSASLAAGESHREA